MAPLHRISTARGEFIIRRAVNADLAAIVGLIAADQIGQSRDGGHLAPYEKAFVLIDADLSQLLVVVADPRTTVVGTLQLSFIPGLARRGALRAQIEAVRVSDGLRGQGIGDQLLTWAIGEARRRGCALVQLTSDKQREDAHRFYARFGFVASHEGFKLQLGRPVTDITRSGHALAAARGVAAPCTVKQISRLAPRVASRLTERRALSRTSSRRAATAATHARERGRIVVRAGWARRNGEVLRPEPRA